MKKTSLPALSRRGFMKGGLMGTAAALVGRALPTHTAEAAAGVEGESGAAALAGLEQVRVQTEVNGKAVALDVHPDDSAIEFVRDRLQLKGCKVSCGHGACGACSMFVDGAPVASCLLPATALEGRKVTTIEGLGPDLHPVQKAFMAEDALQCGYCTPGFVMASVAFFDRWRAEQGTKEPSRDEVAAALAGHLCRCGAYPNIYKAVQAACAGKFDGTEVSSPRREAREKVTGRARYTVDVQLEGQLEGAILRSPHAHARIRELDVSQAKALPGVAAVHLMTAPGRLIRYAGQELVAVAAVDRHVAREALRLIKVTYDVKPAVTSVGMARARGAELVYPPGDQNPANASEGLSFKRPWDGNVRGPSSMGANEPEDAQKAVEVARGEGGKRLVEGRWSSHVQCHTSLEPHNAVAHWEAPDRLKVYLSTQAVTHMAEDIADRFKLKRRAVEVISEHTGGGFGAKARLSPDAVAAIELARLAGKPVHVANSRAEELTVGGLRPGSDMDVSLVIDPAGGLEATTVKAYHDAGTAVGQNTTFFFRAMYPKALCSLEDFDVVTHAPPGEPFRAPGGPNAFWALEQTVDEAAQRLGVDPLELRRRWDPTSRRVPLYDWVGNLQVWKERAAVGADKGRFRRGVGLSTGCWFYFLQTDTEVEIQAGPDGIVVSCGAQDMGNGTRSLLASAVADALGIPSSQVEVRIGSSTHVRGPMSAGSRTTPSVGPSAIDASQQLADALVDLAARKWKLKDARAGNGGVDHAGGHLAWNEVLKVAPEMRFVGRRRKDKDGYFLPFSIGGLAIGKYMSGAAVVVEVEVDTRLGKTRALRSWAGMNIGRVYVPALARSQVLGGVVQGVSYALYEERRLDPPSGRNLTSNLEDYRIMGVGDSPEIEVHFHDEPWENVQGGGIGIGELATISTSGAVGNAVFHATGWRPTTLPLRPDVVLKGVRS